MGNVRRANVLIVDDREENLLALEAILSSLGHNLIRARSGAEALKHLLVEDISLILLDVQMPEMDGYETASHIQGRSRTQNIPIIFLTAIDHEAHQAYRGYAAGAVDFLAKPFDPWMLRAKVEIFLRLYLDRQILDSQVAELNRRVERLSIPSLDADLAQIERLLSMAGDQTEQVLIKEALDQLRAVRGRFERRESLPRKVHAEGDELYRESP
jgi:response regulator RpfG family c-di-GMP phosphodiesterase